MPAGDASNWPPACADYDGELRIEAYVRGAVPAPVQNRITAVTERLQRLCEGGQIDDYRVSQWPAPHQTVADPAGLTRQELVETFEQWADKQGYSLEPAFRRDTVPTTPVAREEGDRIGRLRVPVIALALYEDAKPRTDPESLRSVVPCTASTPEGDQQPQTVDTLLAALEPADGAGLAPDADDDRVPVLEGGR
ncbi:HTH domain-containing protein [Halopiger thermotolerans]